MSIGKSIFYKERSWNDFHYYNGSTINEVKIIESPKYQTYRKDVNTTYHSKYYDKLLPVSERNDGLSFLHDKIYRYEMGVLENIVEYENVYNLFTCLSGKIYFVVVDNRIHSTNFKKWESFILTPENNLQIFVPSYISFGYYIMKNDTILLQKMAYKEYDEIKKKKIVIEKNLNIQWPIPYKI